MSDLTAKIDAIIRALEKRIQDLRAALDKIIVHSEPNSYVDRIASQAAVADDQAAKRAIVDEGPPTCSVCGHYLPCDPNHQQGD